MTFGGSGSGLGTSRLVPLVLAAHLIVQCRAYPQESNLFVWGANERGQLGIGSNQAKHTPLLVDELSSDTFFNFQGMNITQIGTGTKRTSGETSFIVTADGRAATFGDCTYANLGIGYDSCFTDKCKSGSPSLRCQSRAKFLDFNLGQDVSAPKIKSVALGDVFGVALSTDGQLYGWGDPVRGCVGNGCCKGLGCPVCSGCRTVSGECFYFSAVLSTAMMNSTNGRRLRSVTAGADYVLATDEAGDLWGYGNNNNGQLGVGYVNGSSVVLPLKAKLPAGVGLNYLEAGLNHVIALMKDGSVYTWGSGQSGALGHGSDAQALVPTQVYGPGKARAVAAGLEFSLVALNSGKVFGFGSNLKGQLGLPPQGSAFVVCVGAQVCTYSPVEAIGLPDNIVILSAGEAHSFALGSDGQLWGTGDNSFDQLGVNCAGSTNGCLQFTRVEAVRDQRFSKISTGAFWTVAMREMLPPPVFSPAPGTHGPIAFTISHPDPNVIIRFSLADTGSSPPDPDLASTPWDGFKFFGSPGSGEKTVIVKAYSDCDSCGYGNSVLVTATYYIVETAEAPRFGLAPNQAERGAKFKCWNGEKNWNECGMGVGENDAFTCGFGGTCAVNTGTWYGAAEVKITAPTFGSTIHYTLDGSTPTGVSTVFDGVFNLGIPGNYTVRAIAVAPDIADSRVTTALYQVLDLDQDPTPSTGVVAWLAAVIAVVCIVVVSFCAIGGIYAYKLSMKNRVSTLVSKPGDYGDMSVPRGAECAEFEVEAGYHHETHLDKGVHVAVPAAAAGEVGWAAARHPVHHQAQSHSGSSTHSGTHGGHSRQHTQNNTPMHSDRMMPPAFASPAGSKTSSRRQSPYASPHGSRRGSRHASPQRPGRGSTKASPITSRHASPIASRAPSNASSGGRSQHERHSILPEAHSHHHHHHHHHKDHHPHHHKDGSSHHHHHHHKDGPSHHHHHHRHHGDGSDHHHHRHHKDGTSDHRHYDGTAYHNHHIGQASPIAPSPHRGRTHARSEHGSRHGSHSRSRSGSRGSQTGSHADSAHGARAHERRIPPTLGEDDLGLFTPSGKPAYPSNAGPGDFAQDRDDERASGTAPVQFRK